MRHILLLLAFLPCLVPGQEASPGPVLPSVYVSRQTDDAWLAGQAARAILTPGYTVDFGTRLWTFTVPVVVGADYLCLNLKGSGFWRQVGYAGPPGSTWLTVVNLKDSSWENLGVRSTVPGTDGIKLVSTGSSGRNRFQHVMAQGFGTGMLFDAPNGADISQNVFDLCQFTDCATGLKYRGGNALEPELRKCSGIGCETLFDFTEGGAGFTSHGSGGSQCGTVWAVDGGFPFQCSGGVSEGAKVVYRIGSELSAGQGATCSIDDVDHRSAGKIAEVWKAGVTKIHVQAHNGGGSDLVELYNKSNDVGYLECSGVTAKAMEGKWSVNGVAQVQ